MHNITTEDTQQASYDRIRDTELHLRRHGRGLCDLFSVLDAPAGFDALCDLQGIFGNPNPKAEEIAQALGEIANALRNQTASDADQISQLHRFDASPAIR